VRIEFSRAAVMLSEEPPQGLLQRARAKMDSVRASGKVAEYLVFDKRLVECWEQLRHRSDAPDDATVGLTLAAGAPDLPWLQIEKSTNNTAIVYVSINGTKDEVAAIKPEVFETAVLMQCQQLGVTDRVHDAHIQGIYAKAILGQKVRQVGVGRHPDMPATGKPFAVVANKSRKEIMVLVGSLQELGQKNQREQMFGLINQAVRQLNLNSTDTDFKLLKKEFLGVLQNALVGPEFLGIDLPLATLVALGVPKAKRRPSGGIELNYPGAGRLAVEVTDDRMEAQISNFDMALYEANDFDVTIEWVELELKRLNLSAPIPDDLRKMVEDSINQKVDLSGLHVALGVEGKGGRAPFLHPSYKDADSRVQADFENDALDIREIQQRATVVAGQLVAELRYEEEPVAGKTVYGDEVPPPSDDDLVVRVGDGIVEKHKGKFYATADGRPTIEKDSITLSKVLVFEGDVNLRTGNIRFDGPVEIKGSIDSGAIVETTGDLIVHGTIRAAFVRSSGSIAVKTGIVTGAKGRVYAAGDVQADFIENSNVTCGGNLTVVKALLNSQIVCGGRIYVTNSDGVVAGGFISCKDVLRSTHLGFRNGAITTVNVGVDWKVQNAIRIREKRLESVVKTQLSDRASLRELVQKSKAQMTARHSEMKEKLQMRLQKARLLIEKLEEHLQSAKSRLSYNEDARIFVVDQLASNVNVTIAGQKVTVAHDTAGVAITPRRRKGSYIHPIEEIEAMDADNGRRAS
jgi:hypothetical protein